VGLIGDSSGGLDYDKVLSGKVRRESYLSKAQMKAKKEVQDGRKS